MNSPLPLSYLWLLCALPFIALLGYCLASSLGVERKTRDALIPALALSPWLLCIHLIGRITQSFYLALSIGTVLPAIVGLLAFLKRRRDKAPSPKGKPVSKWVWVFALGATALLYRATIDYALHDEGLQTGHMSVPSMMLNDIYPPKHLTFPHAELAYHYAFDILTAITVALTRLRVGSAIDLVVLLCWPWFFYVAWIIGERALKSNGAIVATVVLFAGGFPFACAQNRSYVPGDLIGMCNVEGLWVNPPIVSYFFQHPFTIGFPLALSLILLATEREAKLIPRAAILFLLFWMLSLSQLTLFSTVSAALVAQELFSGKGPQNLLERMLGGRFSIGRALLMLLALLLALACASRLGGFFAHSSDLGGPKLIKHIGVANTLKGSIRWIIACFGALLPLGVIGLFLAPRIRILALSLLLGSLLVINTLRVEGSWDIVKFATVGMLAVALTTGVLLDRLCRVRRIKLITVPIALGLLFLSTGAGFVYPIIFGYYQDIPTPGFGRVYPPLTGDDSVVAAELRKRIKTGEIVYRKQPVALRYALWAGLPQVWTEKHCHTFGFSNARIKRRDTLMKEMPDDIALYKKEHIRYLVLDPSDVALRKHADQWIRAGAAKTLMSVGTLWVVEILQ